MYLKNILGVSYFYDSMYNCIMHKNTYFFYKHTYVTFCNVHHDVMLSENVLFVYFKTVGYVYM